MPKGYVTNWKQRKEPKEERHIVDVWFDSHGEKAMVYDTKQEAENDAALLTKLQVVIPSSEGGKHTCRHFVCGVLRRPVHHSRIRFEPRERDCVLMPKFGTKDWD
jgi:hypothetical protein